MICTLKSFQQKYYENDHDVDKTDKHGQPVNVVDCVVFVMQGAEESHLYTGDLHPWHSNLYMIEFI